MKGDGSGGTSRAQAWRPGAGGEGARPGHGARAVVTEVWVSVEVRLEMWKFHHETEFSLHQFQDDTSLEAADSPWSIMSHEPKGNVLALGKRVTSEYA